MAGRKITWKPPKPRRRKPIKKTARQLKIEEAMQNWEALSEGLSPQQKLRLARDIRGSGRLPKGMQMLYRPVTEDDLRSLALFCCKAIIAKKGKRTDRIFVNVRLPYNYRAAWPTFPTGVLQDADMLSVVMRLNANIVVDFLHKEGYSDFCSSDLRKYLGVLQRKISSVDEDSELAILNAYGYDTEVLGMYEDILNNLLEGENDE